MKFGSKLLLCAVVPALLFMVGLAGSIGGLIYTKNEFNRYIQTEQRIASGLTEMYAQGLQMGQALRNFVLDPANPQALRNLEAARDAYSKAYTDTAAVAAGTVFEPGLARLPALRTTHAQAQERVIELARMDSPDTVGYLNANETPAWRTLRGELLKQIEEAGVVSAQVQANVEQQVNRLILFSIRLARP